MYIISAGYYSICKHTIDGSDPDGGECDKAKKNQCGTEDKTYPIQEFNTK